MWSALLPPTPEPETPTISNSIEKHSSFERLPTHQHSSFHHNVPSLASFKSFSQKINHQQHYRSTTREGTQATQRSQFVSSDSDPNFTAQPPQHCDNLTSLCSTHDSQVASVPNVTPVVVVDAHPSATDAEPVKFTAAEEQAILHFRTLSSSGTIQTQLVVGKDPQQQLARHHFMQALMRLSALIVRKRSRVDEDVAAERSRFHLPAALPSVELSNVLADIAAYLKTSIATFTTVTLMLIVDRVCLDAQLVYVFMQEILVPCAMHWVEFRTSSILPSTFEQHIEPVQLVFQNVLQYLQDKIFNMETSKQQRSAATDVDDDRDGVFWRAIEQLCSWEVYRHQQTTPKQGAANSLFDRMQRVNERIHRQLGLIECAAALLTQKEHPLFEQRCCAARDRYATQVGAELSLIEASMLDTIFSS